MILGNKCDMEEKRAVSRERGEQLAVEYGIKFMETSAKSSINVEEVRLICHWLLCPTTIAILELLLCREVFLVFKKEGKLAESECDLNQPTVTCVCVLVFVFVFVFA